MDTSDWTVEDHIAWIRQYAESARTMARMVIGWDMDALRISAGQAEFVEWPDTDEFGMARGRPKNTRVMHQGGYAYLVRDV